MIQVPPHSLSTSTNLLLHTYDNTSDMENKEINDQTITVRKENNNVIYSQVYLRKLCQYGKNGYKWEEGTQRLKLKHVFICMRDYERYMYKLV